MNQPLRGSTILEINSRDCVLGVRLATQFAGKVALDLGAQVIRIVPQGGDVMYGPSDPAVSAFVDDGKHAITLPSDLHARSDSIAALARDCDAMIVDDGVELGNSVDTPARASIEPPIVAMLSLFARQVERTGSDFTVMALSGLLDTVGDPVREPLRLGGHQLAYSAGLAAYAGIAAAMVARKRRRAIARETVRVSLFDTAMWINWKNLVAAACFDASPSRPGRSATWQVVRCQDGWVALVYVEKDWQALKVLIEDPRLEDTRFASEQGRAKHAREIGDIVESALLGFTRRAIEDRARALRLPLGVIWNPVELAADPQYRAREVLTRRRDGRPGLTPRLPVELHRSPTRASGAPAPAAPEFRGNRVLAGWRVLDLGILTAGAATSALLADLGADVIKVESARYGDPFRIWPTGVRRDDPSADSDCPPYYRATNRNKRSICLDLKSPAGRAVLLRLAARSDVVVENFRRGVLDQLGIAFDDLCAVNERLVLASLSSQGESGPDAGGVSFGSTLEATGGLAWLTGYPEGDPVISGQILNYADQVVSIFGAGMILTALLERETTGLGAHLQISQRELITYLVGEAFVSPDATSSCRRGNEEAPHIVQQCFRSRDGQWIAVTVDTGSAMAVSGLVGAKAAAVTKADELSVGMSSWIARHATADCIEMLSAAGVAVAPVLDGKQALRERFAGGHALVELSGGTLVKGFPMQLDSMPLRVDADAHAMGADTLAILRDVGGYSSTEVDVLMAAGAVGAGTAEVS